VISYRVRLDVPGELVLFVSGLPALFAELLNRGWAEADCKALAGGNILRVMSGRVACGDSERHTSRPPPVLIANDVEDAHCQVPR
jgi:hypothetical protein